MQILKRLIGGLALVFVGVIMGVLLMQFAGDSQLAQQLSGSVKAVQKRAATAAAQLGDVDIRTQVLLENPELIRRISEGGSFGGERHSIEAATNMFGREHQPAIEDVRKKTRVQPVGEGMWLIRMPIVNAVLFETTEGMVLVDTGMAPAGPAIVDAIKSVSDKPLHTVIYTHGHVDHAYGTWALMEEWSPQVIAHENIIPRFERYMRIPGSFAKYMSQKREQIPQQREDLVWPTQTFAGRELLITVGDQRFELKHFKGETDDQLFVWVPGRQAIVAADYYQGFLPNAGNGKRVQRYVEEWAQALRAMQALEPQYLLPNHGAPIDDPAVIQENLGVLAEALQHIVDYTLAALDQGMRKDQIAQNARLPEHLAKHPTLNVQYVSVQDISKMVLKQYTGWWNDIPSHWSPASVEAQAQALLTLAGGMNNLVAYTNQLAETDIQLASHFADWAFYAVPSDPDAQQLVIDIYKARILHPASNTQEMLTYLDQITAARQMQLQGQ